MASLNFDFETWLNDKLSKFINDSDNNDTSIFLSYIISLLNEEDTSLDEKISSIETILQDLNPDKSSDDIKNLSNEISNKYIEVANSETNDHKITQKSNEKLTNANDNNEDPGDAILSLIKEHKNQIVEKKRVDKKNSDDGERVYEASNDRIYHSSDDNSDNENNDELFENRNAETVLQREKQNREKLHDNYLKQKERIKKDQQQQKEREEERKKKARQRAAKVERKC